MKFFRPVHTKGFTLIELLVVISIISMLSSVFMASMQSARIRAQDTRRLSDIRQIQNALELYYQDNKQYPPIQAYSGTSADCNTGLRWCTFHNYLRPYLKTMPVDPTPTAVIHYAYASSGNNYQMYGLKTQLQSPGNLNMMANDGGCYSGTHCTPPYFEVGQQPRYCVQKYPPGTMHLGWPSAEWYIDPFSYPNAPCLGDVP